MNTLTKSPPKVARQALAVGARALRLYAHKNSPRKFTQPQLFSCLVLKTFFKTDYRGAEQMLVDLPDLTGALRKDGPGRGNVSFAIAAAGCSTAPRRSWQD